MKPVMTNSLCNGRHQMSDSQSGKYRESSRQVGVSEGSADRAAGRGFGAATGFAAPMVLSSNNFNSSDGGSRISMDSRRLVKLPALGHTALQPAKSGGGWSGRETNIRTANCCLRRTLRCSARNGDAGVRSRL